MTFLDQRLLLCLLPCVSLCVSGSGEAQVEPLTISTIFSRAGAWVEAWGACWYRVLLGCGHVGC